MKNADEVAFFSPKGAVQVATVGPRLRAEQLPVHNPLVLSANGDRQQPLVVPGLVQKRQVFEVVSAGRGDPSPGLASGPALAPNSASSFLVLSRISLGTSSSMRRNNSEKS